MNVLPKNTNTVYYSNFPSMGQSVVMGPTLISVCLTPVINTPFAVMNEPEPVLRYPSISARSSTYLYANSDHLKIELFPKRQNNLREQWSVPKFEWTIGGLYWRHGLITIRGRILNTHSQFWGSQSYCNTVLKTLSPVFHPDKVCELR